MQFSSIGLALCAVAAVAVTSAPVQAKSASASAQIDQFTYELIDLDLSDGITPGISFTDDDINLWSAYRGDGDIEHRIESLGTTQVLRSGGAAAAAMSATSVSATASLLNPAAPYAVAHRFNGFGRYDRNFVLSPGTGLRISALGSLSAQTEGLGSMAGASIGISASISDDAASSERWLYSSHTYETEQGSGSYRLSAFVHTDDVAMSGRFGFHSYAGTQLYTMPGPVPEPKTYAMLLAGVVLIGLAGRRKRRA